MRRGEILEAAERIFVEHGYDGATIRKIADAVGLSSTALYMHFADKSEILYEICRSALTRLKTSLDEIIAGPGSFRDRLRALMNAYIDFGLSNPNAYRLIYMTRPEEAAAGAQTAAIEVGGEALRALETFVETGAREGRLTVEPRVAAQALWASAHGVVSLMITKPYVEWAPRDVLMQTTLDALIAGLVRS